MRSGAPKRKRVRREPLREQLAGAWECLDMVRVALERCGLPMQGCAPMFYDDAIRQLASVLGRAAGMETLLDVQRHVAEYESGAVGAVSQEPK